MRLRIISAIASLFLVSATYAHSIVRIFSDSQPSGRIIQGSFTTPLYVEDTGKGKPVILVHGFMSTGSSMKRTELYKDLVANGFRVIVPDMRGNGRSGKPHNDEAYANDTEARDLMLIADSFHLDSFAVVGYSRGAIIASRLMIMDKRVTKAVIGGMGADFTNPLWPRRLMFYRALNGEDVPELAGVVKRVQENKLDQKALALLQKHQPTASADELGAVKIPVLVICGDKDRDNGDPHALSRMIPRSVFAEVPGDHGATLRTKEFSERTINFLLQ
jgi:pimeloyl-ACP methyl ester carboxylesterase